MSALRPGQDDAQVLESLLEVGSSLSAARGRDEVLGSVLREARRVGRAEAGTLYTVREGRLRFAVAQNDRLDVSRITAGLLGKEMPVSRRSLAGFVAATGEVLNIPDSYALDPDSPFRLDRSFDAATGYRTRSVLGVPLGSPDGVCVGVLELINHLGEGGEVTAFPPWPHGGLRSLAAIAGVTVHNQLLAEELRAAHLDTIFRLSVAAEFRDDDTGEHVRRISRSSMLLARAMGLDDGRDELLLWASPMHDVGKIGIPDSILRKPGPLTPAERKIMQQHPLIGAQILGGGGNEVVVTAREVALSHHEKWDGSGYPRGLAGEGIPLSGRIVGLADVFDALICKRCYKEAYPEDACIEIVTAQRGRHFDPAVVDAFEAVAEDILAPYRGRG